MRIPAKKTLFLTGAVLAGALALGAGAAVARGWHGGGPGFGGMGGPMMLFDQFDSNKDGKITQDEIDAVRDAQLKKYDRDGDGTLSLEEYQALWLDAMRPRMVRQFQANDADGNGRITTEEFRARFARNGDGAIMPDELRRHGDRGPRGDRDDE